MITFISDLDNTLIYSRQKGVCVEYLKEKELTYMTPIAKRIFSALLREQNFLFIPCTARSYEQTSRVEFVQHLPYLICDMGGSIYIHGHLDEEWEQIQQKKGCRNPAAIEAEKMWVQKHLHIPYQKIHSNRDLFFVVAFANKEIAKQAWEQIKGRSGFYLQYHLQGRKLYCTPTGLDKSRAVEYLKKKYLLENVYTAGDSFFDEDFTKLGVPLLPAHAEFSYGGFRTEYVGMKAGEEIIRELSRLVDIHTAELRKG